MIPLSHTFYLLQTALIGMQKVCLKKTNLNSQFLKLPFGNDPEPCCQFPNEISGKKQMEIQRSVQKSLYNIINN